MKTTEENKLREPKLQKENSLQKKKAVSRHNCSNLDWNDYEQTTFTYVYSK